MSMIALAAGAVILGAGTTAYGNSVKGKALSKSARTEQAALASLEPLNIEELNRVSTKAEIDRFTKSIASQQKLDPTFAGMRTQGSQNILDTLRSDADKGSVQNKSISDASKELDAQKSANDPIIAQLLDRVKADLDAGATLPPEFQAELVKSGLESAGAGGLSIEGRGAGGVGIRTLLGSAGIQLKQSREANARENLNMADALRQKRVAALESLGITSSGVAGQKTARAGGAVAMANDNMPSLGLTGADAAGIAIKNNQFRNAQKLGIASSKQQNTLGQAALTAGTVGAIGSGVSSLAGGQYGTWVGGLLQKGKA